MKVLKNIWKGIRFSIGMIFTVPFLISMFCTYLFGIAVAVFDYSIIDKISEKLSIVKNNNTELTDEEMLNAKRELETLIVELEKLKEALNDRVAQYYNYCQFSSFNILYCFMLYYQQHTQSSFV